MISLAEHHLCTGCGACEASCVRRAISLVSDEEGFLYPKINHNICIGCGFCVQKCPVVNRPSPRRPIAVLAAKCLSEEMRQRSSSGGIFPLLASAILKSGGVVYGASLTSDCRMVVHRSVRNIDDLRHLVGSKYVQSDLSHIYGELRSDVEDGRPVLFSGTPCQVAAIRSYLGLNASKVVTVEVVCHAVPSPKIWNAYVDEQEALVGSRLACAEFRNKVFGWKRFSMRLLFENGVEKIHPLDEDSFLRAFLNEYCNRPSCHECRFREFRSGADITIGDFWRAEHSFSGADEDTGLSVVIINTIVGEQLFKSISSDLRIWNSNLAQAIQSNPILMKCTQPNKDRVSFIRKVSLEGQNVSRVIERLACPSFFSLVRIKLGALRRKIVRR